MTIQYEPLKNDWLCYCTNDEVEKLLIFLDMFNYNIWPQFREDRYMRSENQVIYEVSSFDKAVCRVTNYKFPPNLIFDNVDELIKYHMENICEKN